MIPVLLLSFLVAGSAHAQDVSGGTSALVSDQAAISASMGRVDQPYTPASPVQPGGPSQPMTPSLFVTMQAPQQPFQPGLPGVPGAPVAPNDPQQPSRSPLVPVTDPAGVTVNIVSIRVPGQLQNVSASINTLMRTLNSGGQ
jgi:hypothetical protein